MRITFVSPAANRSGGSAVTLIHAHNLQQRGHQVLIVSPSPARLPLTVRLKNILKREDRSVRHTEAFDLQQLGIEHRVLESARPVTNDDVPDADVIIATWWETAEWVNNMTPKKGRKIYFVQGHEVYPYLPVDRCKATYGFPFHKIVVSDWLARVMKDEYGDCDVDIVLNNYDKATFFAPARGKQAQPTVGFLYSTTPPKGVDIAIQAINILRKNIPDLRVLAFGNERIHKRLPLPTRTEFYFGPSKDLIRGIYSSCDVWISASRSEGFNLTVLESMACRTPCVATQTGWPADAIKDGWNGALVPFEDPIEMSEQISTILNMNGDNWVQLSSNAYNTAAALDSWQRSTELFERSLLRNNSG